MNVASLLKKQGIRISRYFSNAGKNERFKVLAKKR